MNIFDEYARRYDMSVPEINYKYHHSYRVKDNMVVLAKSLNLPIKDVKLAETIGLLHDVGRFEQLKRFKSFNDSLLDHGDYAITVIKEENMLEKLGVDPIDYDVVYKAIKNHNKYTIESNLNERELLFTKLIRDADKLDILFALNNKEIKSVIYEDDGIIRDHIKEAFFNNEQVKKDDNENRNENIVIMFAFVYDFNFNVSLDIIKNKKYYEKIYDRLEHKELFMPYIEHIKEYIEERTR